MNNSGFEARLAAVEAHGEFKKRRGLLLAGLRAIHSENPALAKERTIALANSAWESFENELAAKTPPTADELKKPRQIQKDLARLDERGRKAHLGLSPPRAKLYESGPMEGQETDESKKARETYEAKRPTCEKEVLACQKKRESLLKSWDSVPDSIQLYVMTDAPKVMRGKASAYVPEWDPPSYLGGMLIPFVTGGGSTDTLVGLSEEGWYDLTIQVRVGLSSEPEDDLFRTHHSHSRDSRPKVVAVDGWHDAYREAAFMHDLLTPVETEADADRHTRLEHECLVKLGEKALVEVGGRMQEELPVLTQRQQRFRDIVLERGPHDATPSPSLVATYNKLYRDDPMTDEAFRKRVAPGLMGAWGMRNTPKVGYYFPEDAAARRLTARIRHG